MGFVNNLETEKYPLQKESQVGKLAKVSFWNDTDKVFYGNVIRADAESPNKTFILLEDGRIIQDTECLFKPRELWLKSDLDAYMAADEVQEFKIKYKEDQSK